MSAVTQPSLAYRSEGLVLSSRHRLVIQLTCAAALVAGLFARLVGWDKPLWLDETFTGAIAFQPELSVLFEDCLNELGGPIYYAFAWGWVQIFGASNVSLRMPSIVFSIIAPLLVLWRGDRDWIVRCVWASLLAVVFMAAYYSHEARAYSLLLLLGVVQVIIFRSLIVQPTRRGAYGWAAVSVIFTLTHLFTLPLTGFQWLALVAFRGRSLRRHWPAMLLFLLPIGWLTLQLPVFARFMGVGVWYATVDFETIKFLERDIFGQLPVISWLIRITIAAMMLIFFRDGCLYFRMRRPIPYELKDILAISCAVAALATLLIYGYFRPSFTSRYAMPMLPSLLLALAIWSRRMARHTPIVPAAVILLFTVAGTMMARQALMVPTRNNFQWQDAAESMMAQGVSHVAFFWDNRAAKVGSRDLVTRVGSFFFDRAGTGVRSETLILTGRTDDPDPNIILTSYLDSTRVNNERDGFIWAVRPGPLTIWSRHPARLDELARQFECRDHVTIEKTVILACVRRIPKAASN